jgi:putative heme iron utilization protein
MWQNAEALTMAETEDGSRAGQVRALLRAARQASLATADGTTPYAALVTPACTGDLSIVLLLSELSLHTAQLRANPHCALLCTAPGGVGLYNPQTLARVTVVCEAAVDPDPALRRRYLALHPYAALYAGFEDFHIWRLRIRSGQLVSGFAQAWRFGAGDVLPDAARAAAIAAAEDEVLRHCNAAHAAAMDAIGVAYGGSVGRWALSGVDGDGCDLIGGDAYARVAWPHPVADVEALHHALVALARQARGHGAQAG